MHAVETLVVGAGQAGLAVSRCLTAQGADHVVVERGRIAERWRSARWESLRLLTPNWMSRLPAWSYPGPDPDGYMTAPELVSYLEDYAGSFTAPVHENTTVELVEASGSGLRVVTDQGTWLARNVVVATGTENRAYLPPAASGIDPAIQQLTGDLSRFPAAVCWWSVPQRPAPRSPMSCAARGGRWSFRWEGMRGYRAATGAATSCGGWTGPGSWARPSSRCTTRGRPVGRRRCSYRAAVARSAWMRWQLAG